MLTSENKIFMDRFFKYTVNIRKQNLERIDFFSPKCTRGIFYALKIVNFF